MMAKVAVCLLLTVGGIMAAPSTKALAPNGDVLIAPSANELDSLLAPELAPSLSATAETVQADCLTEEDVFYGSDFLSTVALNTSTAKECCSKCKLAVDCTVWNWCGKEGGCALPPILQSAGNRTSFAKGTCVYKPRPISYAGTLPVPPTANISDAMKGWTSGIPINATLLPALPGFELSTGIEMEYSEDTDFYCRGSTTTKPVCQLYGTTRGGASACLNNPLCRGFQICWAFPAASTTYKQQPLGNVRLKAGPQAPLNITGAYQNPYCSVYVLKAGGASAPNSGDGGYSLKAATNTSALNAASEALNSAGTGRKLLQAGPDGSATAPSPSMMANSAEVETGNGVLVGGTPFASAFTEGNAIQTFENVTFNYTQCYSGTPTIRVVLQPQTFPLETENSTGIHSWTEVPFRNSGDVCCAFKDVNDIFLDLETGDLALSTPMFVATNPNLTSEGPLRNYDTTPASIAKPLVYIPDYLMSTPAGAGRSFTFPPTNSSAYISALEELYYSVCQAALGYQFCNPGYPQLASTVDFLGQVLEQYANDSGLTPGGVPANLSLQTSSSNPDGSFNGSCLVEWGANYEGVTLRTKANSTVESCCADCWSYAQAGTAGSPEQCDVWVFDTTSGACAFKSSDLAAQSQIVPAGRTAATGAYISGRRTAVQPQNSTQLFLGLDS